ncbi:MAG: hypothetical protein H6510_08440 [Acidobacteria bacterium]|nr:hypothetical protein [Acidobacteriota bacterium]MCB9397829.1 hypothetical protein [Acidobacteriota bacterium]
MAEKHYQLLAGETKFLKIKWDSSWRDLSLILDGRTILVVPDYRSLKEGRSVTLNDGTTFFVQLKNGFLTHQLSVWMNDVALSEPTGDPEDRLKGAYFVLFLLAGINGLVGLATLAFGIVSLKAMGLGWISVFYGVVFGLTGWFVKRRSLAALILASVLFFIDSVFVVMAMAEARNTNVWIIFLRVFFLYFMLQGIPALRELANRPSPNAAFR